MSIIMSTKNRSAMNLSDSNLSQNNPLKGIVDVFTLSKKVPYYGYVDVKIGDTDTFTMFSNNDDFVVKNYFWFGKDAFEPMSLKIWSVLSSSSLVTFDIGAYSGVYSLCSAVNNRKSKIYAFEALDTVHCRLLINKVANQLDNIRAFNLALSDKSGPLDLNVYAGEAILSSGSSIIDRNLKRKVFEKKRVQTISLDQFTAENGCTSVNLLKIDVEGAEALVFDGGKNTIARHKPDILCEFLKGANIDEIGRFLKPLGYNFYRIDDENMLLQKTSDIMAGERGRLNTLLTCKPESEMLRLIESCHQISGSK